MTLQVLLLMAGRGSRFAAAGFDTSKPLIDVDGTPMFARALAGLSALAPYELTVAVRQEQIDLECIDARVRAVVPDARVVALPGVTRGAAETALLALPALRADGPVIVLDCDLSFESEAYTRSMLDRQPGERVVLLTFEAVDPRYSFVRIDTSGAVVEIAEKRPISDRAVAGAYGFSSVALLRRAAALLVDRELRDGVAEYYMSEVVRSLLEADVPVTAARVDAYTSYGTPEEMEAMVVVER